MYPDEKNRMRRDLAAAREFLAAAAHSPEEDGLVWQARRLRLNTLVGLRWLAVGGQTLAILVSYFGLGLDFPIVPCLALGRRVGRFSISRCAGAFLQRAAWRTRREYCWPTTSFSSRVCFF